MTDEEKIRIARQALQQTCGDCSRRKRDTDWGWWCNLDGLLRAATRSACEHFERRPGTL